MANHHAVSPHLGTPTRYPAATSSVTPVDNRSPTSARPRSRRGEASERAHEGRGATDRRKLRAIAGAAREGLNAINPQQAYRW
jgi:hypothetical protein